MGRSCINCLKRLVKMSFIPRVGRGTIRIDCMRGRVMSRRIFLGFMLVMNVVHLFCADRQEQLKHLCEVLVYVPEENGNGGSLELDAFHPSLPSDADRSEER